MTHNLKLQIILFAINSIMMYVPTSNAQMVRTLPTQSQLPVSAIGCIFQDSEGFMWYGTVGGGLCRDNGYQIDVFRSDINTPGLIESNYIQCITEDSEGNIWFGTMEGVYKIDKNTYEVTNPGKNNERASSLLLDSEGNIWVGFSTYICCFSKEGNITKFEDKACPKENAIQIFEDSHHDIWALYWLNHIWKLNRSTRCFEKQKWDCNVTPLRIIEDKEIDAFWIATFKKGVVLYDRKTGAETLQPSTYNDEARSILIDLLIDKKEGLLWTSTASNLYVYRRNGKELQPVETSSYLEPGYKMIDHMFEDSYGNIWVGGNSVYTFIISMDNLQLERYEISKIRERTGFPLLAESVVQDGDGFWIWQNRIGLIFWHKPTDELKKAYDNTYKIYTEKCKEGQGVWMASGKDLYLFTHSGSNIMSNKILTTEKEITHITDNGDGLLYLGTSDGLKKYSISTKTLSHLSSTTDRVSNIEIDSYNNIYFVIEGGGIRKYSQKEGLSVFKDKAYEKFTGISVAPDGILWAATKEGAVYYLNPESETFIKDDQMSNANGDAIFDLKTDRSGHVWILSNQYVREFNPQTHAFRTLRNTDPQINVTCFYKLENVDDYHIGIGGAGAYCVFESSAELDRKKTTGQKPIVTSIKMEDSLYLFSSNKQDIEIPCEVSNIVVMCSTLQPMSSEKVTFAYKVDDWNEEWIYLPQGINTIYISNLPKGKHTLRIRATDNNGCWSEAEGEFTIRQLPHWWETWWANILFFILALVIIYVFWQLNKRIRYLIMLQKKRRELRLDEIQLQPNELKSTKMDDDFLKRAIRLVEKNISDTTYNVEKFSSDMCMSRINLYRKLQSQTGQSPIEFIRDIRLKKAATLLLRYPNISVNEVAERVGFQTPSYFTKCFKNKFDILPTQYSANNEKEKQDKPLTN